MKGKDILRHKFPGILIALVVTLVGFISVFGIYSNVYAAENINVTINKEWLGDAPVDSVDFTIRRANTSETTKVTVSKSENWTKTVVVPSGTYYVDELDFDPGDQTWSSSVTYERDSYGNYTFRVVNFLEDAEPCNIEITKVWEDDNNKAEKRPDKVTGTLIIPGTDSFEDYSTNFELNEENKWTQKFTLIDGSKYSINNLKLYEVSVDGYSTDWEMTLSSSHFECYITITNTLKPESEQTYDTINVPNSKKSEEILCDFDILKKSSDNNTLLSGAEFVLQNSEGKYAEFTEPSDGLYEFSGWVSGETDTTTLTSDSYGYIHVTEIDAGTYTLTETKAPDGYTGLADSVTFTLSSDSITISTGGPNGVTADGTTMTVVNTTGSELPETGGPGTFTFYMTGMLLTGSAFLLAILRRRRRWVI